MHRYIKILFSFIIVLSLGIYSIPFSEAATSTQTVSPGVTYNNQTFITSGLNETAHLLTIDLNNPFSKIGMGVPNSNKLLITSTAKANGLSRNGYQVVSAINGSFFNMSARNPVNLISQNNKLLNIGSVSKSKNSYVNQPIAFGVLANGMIQFPIKFSQMYIAEAISKNQGKGSLYFDILQAVYNK